MFGRKTSEVEFFKYWKFFIYLIILHLFFHFRYILLISVIAFYISKNDQTLVKKHKDGLQIHVIKTSTINYQRITIDDVTPETRHARLLNLTNTEMPMTKKPVSITKIKSATTGSQITLSDKIFIDYFRDNDYPKPVMQPEVRHIAFLKVHKAASSTMQNMFFRFGRKRNLTFVFTKHPNYFSRSPKNHIPLAPKYADGYDILCNHGVFNFSTYSSLLPNDTVYIGIVRDPLSVFISAVNFYSQESQKLGYLIKIKGQKLQKLIHRPEVYDRNFFSYTKNVMARDFGFPETFNNSIIFQTLKELDKIFNLVLIVEHFEESLVLMRRYLNWKLEDILFLPNNVYIKRVKTEQGPYHFQRNTAFDQARVVPWYGPVGMLRGLHRDKPESKSDLSPSDIREFKIRNKMDYYVYSFFTKKFWKQFKSAPANNEQEVTYFKQVLEKLKLFCNLTEIDGDRKPLMVRKSEWNDDFIITVDDCAFMKMEELKFIKILRYKQGSELKEVKRVWPQQRHDRISLNEIRRMHKQQLLRNKLPHKQANSKQKGFNNLPI